MAVICKILVTNERHKSMVISIMWQGGDDKRISYSEKIRKSNGCYKRETQSSGISTMWQGGEDKSISYSEDIRTSNGCYQYLKDSSN